MICPYCNEYTTTHKGICINCSRPLDSGPAPYHSNRNRTKSSSSRGLILFVAILILGIASIVFISDDSSSSSSSSHSSSSAGFAPGQEFDIEDLVVDGKITIFDFYSEYCPPCRKISPLLRRLDRKRDDIAVIKIDINRQGTREIDWGSPLAIQYNLKSIPYFIVYKASGSLWYKGRKASTYIYGLIQKEGIR